MAKKIVNGLDVAAIQGMVDTVKKQSQVAQAKFLATTEWRIGFNNEASIKDFWLGGAKNEKSRTKPFVIIGDHPAELLGTNKGPTSVEVVLAALGHLIASGFARYGAHIGILIESLRVDPFHRRDRITFKEEILIYSTSADSPSFFLATIY